MALIQVPWVASGCVCERDVVHKMNEWYEARHAEKCAIHRRVYFFLVLV